MKNSTNVRPSVLKDQLIDLCVTVDGLGLFDTWLSIDDITAITGNKDGEGCDYDLDILYLALETVRYADDYEIDKGLTFISYESIGIKGKGPVIGPAYKICDARMHSDDLKISDKQRHKYIDESQKYIQKAVDEIEEIKDAVEGKDKELFKELDAATNGLHAIL